MEDSIRYTLSLPQPLNIRVKTMASALGLPVATFIRHLIIEEVKKNPLPIYHMSAVTEKIIEDTEQQYLRGKLKEYKTIKDMFNSLDKGK
jgi:predicted DNA-binding protein